MKKKVSKKVLIDMILTKLNRPDESGLKVTASEIAKETGWTRTYVSTLASNLRHKFKIPIEFSNFDEHVELAKKNHPELVKKDEDH